MNLNSISSLISVTLLVPLVILLIFSLESEAFTVDLIHRDSPLSPFHNPSVTRHIRMLTACNRSLSRHNSFSLKRSIRSRVISHEFEFLMQVSIGTPPVNLFLIADTGSDLIWTKSTLCTGCSNGSHPITYNPKISSSYRLASCHSSACKSAYPSTQRGCGRNNSCLFEILYGDGSQSSGFIGLETMGLGSNVLPNITFGASETLVGSFPGSGIIGLGSGPASLVKQLGNLVGGARFSYCLSNNKSIGKISFGDKSIPIGPKVVSTPMVSKEPYTYYYLTINSFDIGTTGKKIEYGVAGIKGNIIIDSGTTLTLLPRRIYDQIKRSYWQQIKGKPIIDPTGMLGLCFKTNNVDEFPPMTVYFDGGSKVVLSPSNTFVSVSEGVFCLAALPHDRDLSIYGNIWQENMVVGYDLEKKQILFMPGGCPMY